MFDSDLSPQELRNRYGWQACKKISIESNATNGIQLKSQDELIGKDGSFRIRKIYKTNPNNNVSEKSEDEQFYDTRDSLTDPKKSFNDKIENFNKLNEVISGRINEINGNQKESTGKVSKEKRDSDIINTNKKRVAQNQVTRGSEYVIK
ncbi:unnamed protein product [Rhizophagus irregularis]|nr:unnamed protein product [Rhizophagus irregularis]